MLLPSGWVKAAMDAEGIEKAYVREFIEKKYRSPLDNRIFCAAVDILLTLYSVWPLVIGFSRQNYSH
jgi:hypothetical protein